MEQQAGWAVSIGVVVLSYLIYYRCIVWEHFASIVLITIYACLLGSVGFVIYNDHLASNRAKEITRQFRTERGELFSGTDIWIEEIMSNGDIVYKKHNGDTGRIAAVWIDHLEDPEKNEAFQAWKASLEE